MCSLIRVGHKKFLQSDQVAVIEFLSHGLVGPFLSDELMELNHKIECCGEQNTYFAVLSSLSRLVPFIDNPYESLNCSKMQGKILS